MWRGVAIVRRTFTSVAPALPPPTAVAGHRPLLILGIETSCDDTAAAVVDGHTGRVLSDVVVSQINVHKATGGIVPVTAALEHEAALPSVTAMAIERSGVSFGDLTAIAITKGPGLAYCLRAGVRHANQLATLYRLPLLPIHHIEVRVWACRWDG
jgi:N6-L-threonylcarbamoyladenine synthase